MLRHPVLEELVWICNIISTIIFIVEMLLKQIAYTSDYFGKLSNILEVAIVIAR